MPAYIKAVLTGLLIMALCVLTVAFPKALIAVLFFTPGLIFAIFLLSINNDENYAWKNVLFAIICTFSYSACISIIGLIDTDFRLLQPLNIIIASCVGAVIMSASYQSLILRKFSFVMLLICLALCGLVSATPSAVLLYYFNDNHYINRDDSYLIKLAMSCIFIIFPLWQGFFVGIHKVRISLFELPDDEL